MSRQLERRAAAPLFRAEAVAEQESRWLGHVLIVPRLGQTLAVALSGMLALGVLGLLAFGQYTRSERLSGWLVPVASTPSQGSSAGRTRLEAWLYGPGEAIGAIRPGQRVHLRYDAFPHHRYGQHEGVVRQVVPAELALAEIAAVTGDPALTEAGPLFRVEVELPRQMHGDSGLGTRLLSSMTLEADVLIETRRVWEWVLSLDDALAGRDRAGPAG